MFGHHGDAELPHINFFVIGGGHKPSSILNESESIDRAKMFFVLLHNVFRVSIKLKDFLVGAPC